MAKYGPREWSPRRPLAEDVLEVYDLWSEIKGEIKAMDGMNDIQHALSKMAEFLYGEREKLTKEDLMNFNSAIWSMNRQFERISEMINTQAMPMTVELAKWVKKAVKEGQS